jgi:peptide chain release factor subunit 1
LPKKHARGGQSASRFSRLRDEARHNYIRKVAELAATCFLKDNATTVQGLILAGSADLKTDLQSSDLFDKRLLEKVLKVADIENGGNLGFNEAIEVSAHVLDGVKLIEEQKILKQYFFEIARDTGKVCYGITDTIKALEMGAVDKIIISEDLDLVLRGCEIYSKNRKVCESAYLFGDKGKEEKVQLVDWLVENHKNVGIELFLVSDSSAEGNQFVKGMGSIGAFLRWNVHFDELNEFEEYEGSEGAD